MLAQNQSDARGGFFETLLQFVGKGKVALLEAYFDESERANGLLCVAGYVFAAPQARKLTKEFRAAFGSYGGFHMKELVHKRKGYKGISDKERARLVKRAVDIVNKRFTYGVAITVNRHEYETQAPRWIRGFKNAYPYLCHMAMLAVATLAEKHNDPGPITYIFEAGNPFEAEARDAVKQVATTPELKRLYRHSGDAFLPKADAVPMQAADLLSWETAKFKVETEDENLRPIRESLLSLLAANPKRYHVSFCGGATLTRTLKKYGQLHPKSEG